MYKKQKILDIEVVYTAKDHVKPCVAGAMKLLFHRVNSRSCVLIYSRTHDIAC
ncbi:MAG: hypothetical protein KAX05_16125 [Bacteroidales bacterium]|nr:hypothetical protein [Bacteroidales bacterium]